MENNENKKNQIQIEVPADEMQGRYSNLAVITHGPNDFFLDMILMGPNTPKARVQSRIIIEIRPRNAGGGNGPINFPLPKGQA